MTFSNPPPAGDLADQLVGGCRRRPAADEHSVADDRDGARGHRVGGVADDGLLDPRDESVTIPSARLQPRRHDHQADDAAAPLPAVILIGGSGPTDRDETVAGHSGVRPDRARSRRRRLRRSCATTSAASARAAAAPSRRRSPTTRKTRAGAAVAREAEGRRQGTHRPRRPQRRRAWWRC